MGNNGILVKSLLQSRPWWVFRNVSEMDSCNLAWSEWKNETIISTLKKKSRNVSGEAVEVKVKNQHKEKSKQFGKISGVHAHVWNHFDQTDRGYLRFNKKIDGSKFEEFCKKHLGDSKVILSHHYKDKRIVNHLPGCLQLHSKKLLLANLRKYASKYLLSQLQTGKRYSRLHTTDLSHQ